VRTVLFTNPPQARPWWRFTLLGLIALLWLCPTRQAQASCGYYVVIGHPSEQTAVELAKLPADQFAIEHSTHRKAPCNGPQCRGQRNPIVPIAPTVNAAEDQMLVTGLATELGEHCFTSSTIDRFSFLSDPHIWRIDPPPRG
jgi:hypothetical protein